MRIILSRKGFDKEWGGGPSPILPDGKLLSLPIPGDYERLYYSDLNYDHKNLLVLMKELGYYKVKLKGKRIKAQESRVHLDPDLRKETLEKRATEWKPLFGQDLKAQGHLRNEGIQIGDIFLFFGRFKETEYKDNQLAFIHEDHDKHVIFGYLQIGEIIDRKCKVKKFMQYHPHAQDIGSPDSPNNIIYAASENLKFENTSLDKSIKGSGTFVFNEKGTRDKLTLTKKGESISKWKLPSFLKKASISCHTHNSWKKSYFQSAYPGQEFVIGYKPNTGVANDIENWVKSLILDSVDL